MPADLTITWPGGSGPLDKGLREYAGLKPGIKPGPQSVQRAKELLGKLVWAPASAQAPCVIAAWLGGAPDLAAMTNWAALAGQNAFEVLESQAKSKGAAQTVCGVHSDWSGDVPSVSWYIDTLGGSCPASAGLLKSAGNASASAAAASAAVQQKQDVEKVKEKAKEIAKDAANKAVEVAEKAASAAGTALTIGGIGLSGLLVIAVIVAVIVYAPKRA